MKGLQRPDYSCPQETKPKNQESRFLSSFHPFPTSRRAIGFLLFSGSQSVRYKPDDIRKRRRQCEKISGRYCRPADTKPTRRHSLSSQPYHQKIAFREGIINSFRKSGGSKPLPPRRIDRAIFFLKCPNSRQRAKLVCLQALVGQSVPRHCHLHCSAVNLPVLHHTNRGANPHFLRRWPSKS